MAICDVCFRHCQLKDGQLGFCGGRIGDKDGVKAYNYGKITSLALDPIEKKPLRRFYPGSMILSAGSFGCNIRCPFCQNYEISWSKIAQREAQRAEYISPEDMLKIGLGLKDRGNIGIAFTYNEPLIGYEYMVDCGKLFHEQGMKCVLVSNGTAELPILEKLIPYIDAMNIDLKGFSDEYYANTLKGDRKQVMAFIEEAVKHCHAEITTLIVPDENDSRKEIRQLAKWISELKDDQGHNIGQDIPLHLSRFFPRFQMTDRKATDVALIYELADLAREDLNYVYTGNC
ncbi:MAG: AmmeMemoRadiSam system radical SAM enzyme [Erysipelotrichaceae bacterium]|nr:AmmeMemoRadiSam system radical SAM enzyme [Erysipelotrichaceae bacterium]